MTYFQIFIIVEDKNVRPYFRTTELNVQLTEERIYGDTSLVGTKIFAVDESVIQGVIKIEECSCHYRLGSTEYSGTV